VDSAKAAPAAAASPLRVASTTAATANPAMTCSRNSQPITGTDRYPVRYVQVNAGGGSQQARTRDPQRQLRPPGHLALPVPARGHYIYLPAYNRVHGAPSRQVQPGCAAYSSLAGCAGSKRELPRHQLALGSRARLALASHLTWRTWSAASAGVSRGSFRRKTAWKGSDQADPEV